MKKAAVLFIAFCLLFCAACQAPADNPSATAGQPDGTSSPTAEGFMWEGKYAPLNGERTAISLEAQSMDTAAPNVTFTIDDEATLTLEQALDAQFNYYTITFKSSQPLWMYVGYEKDGELYEELCFLEAGEEYITFKSYVDGFMDGLSASMLKSFRFSNRGEENANVEITALGTEQKPSIEKDVYLENEYIKIGADLVYGGALSYLEYINEPVALVTMNDRAEVGINYADLVDEEDVRSTSVNLLNNFDTGRLVQQSYYGTNQAPYEPGEYMGREWNYNPVMGGDTYQNSSKIIDFEVTDTHIYVKCRPMDWAKDNVPTMSYMESTYTLDGRNLLVDNRFVDFSPYEHIQWNQELPAFYVIEPLYRLAYYPGRDTWNGELVFRDNLPFWDGVWTSFTSREHWWAWVNGAENVEDSFGIGLYVPDVNTVMGGIFSEGGEVGDNPAKASPTCYIAALKAMTLIHFKPLEYSYAIACGSLNDIRESFKELSEEGTMSNQSLLDYNK